MYKIYRTVFEPVPRSESFYVCGLTVCRCVQDYQLYNQLNWNKASNK